MICRGTVLCKPQVSDDWSLLCCGKANKAIGHNRIMTSGYRTQACGTDLLLAGRAEHRGQLPLGTGGNTAGKPLRVLLLLNICIFQQVQSSLLKKKYPHSVLRTPLPPPPSFWLRLQLLPYIHTKKCTIICCSTRRKIYLNGGRIEQNRQIRYKSEVFESSTYSSLRQKLSE